MLEMEIDGKKLEAPEGSTVLQAAEKAGVYIPHFCYHKKLSIAASCRMCLVDVEKMPKPVPACATTVTNGMVVRTRADKAVQAQKAVMEFMLANHPLDCPVCDQGGECQLQDLAVGYGASSSRFREEKRVVAPKEAGPLISMKEMSRCIQCTRCVRFGQEIAGVMELGMSNRGEFSAIESFMGASVDSELSGNMIDVCPVGALTSKPFRYSARTWELARRKSISPHDSCGANLIVQVKNNRVMRVVPFENEAVNECWIADRDRFSYEALNGPERLTAPMLKVDGEWKEVDWQTALEHIATVLGKVRWQHGAGSIGALVSPHATLEELHLAGILMRGLGSENIDYRLRHAEFAPFEGVRWLGMPIASLSGLQVALVLGSNLRKDHPLFAQRIRQAVRRGGALMAVTSADLLADASAWAMPLHTARVAPSGEWIQVLCGVAAAIAKEKNVAPPAEGVEVDDEQRRIALALLSGERKAILLGNAAAHHPDATKLLALCQWIGAQTGASVGYLTESANTVGAQLVGAFPKDSGLNAGQMLSGGVRALFLFGCEPGKDSPPLGASDCELVVTLNPFKANMDVSNVLLPVAPFTETSGTFVNAEGRVQSFHAAVKPAGETHPGWEVLHALAHRLGATQKQYQTSRDVLAEIFSGDVPELVDASRLSNKTAAPVCVTGTADVNIPRVGIYQLDGIVRRAPSLQKTADAREGASHE